MVNDLSIIVPVFNEKGTIVKLLEKLTHSIALTKYNVQIVVVNDGSTDGTTQLLESCIFRNDPRFIWLDHKKNLGKGFAIRTGLVLVTGKFTIVQDADLEYDPSDIFVLLKHAEEKKLEVVFGSRNINSKNQKGSFAFYWGGKTLSWLTNILFKQKLTDEATCYKLVKTELLKSLSLTCKRFEFCPELTARLALLGIKIIELPISYFPRGKNEGKKIGLLDWFDAVWTLFRVRVDIQKDWVIALICFVVAFSGFAFTWRDAFMGYEKETAQSAIDIFSGKYQVFRAGPGAVAMYLPFVGIAKLFSLKDWLSFLSWVPIFYSAVTSSILYLILSKLNVKKTNRLPVVFIVTFLSVVWSYTQIGMEYQAMLWLSVLLLALITWQKNKGTPIFIGTALAMLAFSKSYGIIFIIPTVLFIFSLFRQNDSIKKFFKLNFLLNLFAPSILTICVSLGLNLIILGKLSGAYSLAQEFQIWSWWEGFFGIFFSAGKSIFIYSPFLIPALWGFKKFWDKDKPSCIFVTSSFLILLCLTAPFSFWSDETISVRKLVPVIPLLHLPLAYLSLEGLNIKLKRILLSVFIAGVFYIQLINSFYPYWLGLSILRPYNLDTLTTIRYNPRLSPIALNHKLFVSNLNNFLNNKSYNLYYFERTWMRCCTGSPEFDPMITKINISLKYYDRPDIYLAKYIDINKKNKRTFFVLNFLTILTFSSILFAKQKNLKLEEEILEK
jgi:dolichol-phosphate mannosyltransferase